MKKGFWIVLALLMTLSTLTLLLLKTGQKHTTQETPPNPEDGSDMFQIAARQVRYDRKWPSGRLSFTVTDDSGRQVKLLSLLDGGPKLVFRFTEYDCSDCVEAQLGMIAQLTNSIGKENVVFLVSYSSNHALSLLKQNYHLKGVMFNVGLQALQNWDIEGLNTPYCFIADRDGLYNFFVPVKSIPTLSAIYYNNVQSMFADYFQEQNAKDTGSKRTTSLRFDRDTIVLKDWPLRKPADFTFHFSNTGKFPLRIEKVAPSCECVQAQWPRYPVQPGDSAVITLQYRPTETGAFQRQVNVFGNTAAYPFQLNILGNVIDQ